MQFRGLANRKLEELDQAVWSVFVVVVVLFFFFQGKTHYAYSVSLYQGRNTRGV